MCTIFSRKHQTIRTSSENETVNDVMEYGIDLNISYIHLENGEKRKRKRTRNEVCKCLMLNTVCINYSYYETLDIIMQRTQCKYKHVNPFLKLFPSLPFAVCRFIIYFNTSISVFSLQY